MDAVLGLRRHGPLNVPRGAFSRLGIEHTGDAAKLYGGAAVFFVYLFTATFGATWLTVPWLYPAEIFPLEVRARGNAWGLWGGVLGMGG